MKKTITVLIVISFLLLCSCQKTAKKTFFALDTVVEIKTYGEIPDGAEEYVKELEKVFSKTDTKSELYLQNEKEESTPSKLLYGLIKRSLDISADTKGAFDITSGALTGLWDEAAEKGALPDAESINACKENCGYEKVRAENGSVYKPKDLKFDLGAVAKGYIAELTVKKLQSLGVSSGFASFGGSIAVIGDKPDGSGYKIGVRSPDGDGVIGYTVIRHGIVSTSGDYERYFEYGGKRYHHIIDTATGMPSQSGVRSCTVISDDGTVSDALSTALFVNPSLLDELYGKYDFEAVLITENKTVITTAKAEFVITAKDYSPADR